MSKCVSQDFLLYGNKLRSVGYSKYCLFIKKKKKEKKLPSRHNVCNIHSGYISKEKPSGQVSQLDNRVEYLLCSAALHVKLTAPELSIARGAHGPL